jgi:sugar/nucleoside kinase (ribokinase family)
MGTPDEARPRIEQLVALADVVKASDEDIAWLYPDRSVPDTLRHWGSLGASLTVVTRGGEGALYALAHVGSVATCPARKIGLIDTVGAGDSFMAGLLSGLLDAGLLGDPAARELRWRATGRGARRHDWWHYGVKSRRLLPHSSRARLEDPALAPPRGQLRSSFRTRSRQNLTSRQWVQE